MVLQTFSRFSTKMPFKDPQHVCESLLSIDPEIIYATILSFTGEKMSSASKPSAGVMIPSNDQLATHFKAISSMMAIYSTSAPQLRQGERLFGELKDIVATFSNLKIIMILNPPQGFMIALVTLKDSDSKKITFQVSKIIEGSS
jgi:hypothetical protein